MKPLHKSIRAILLACSLYGNALLHAQAPQDDWATYQLEILKEQPEFSGWCPTKKAEDIMNLILMNNSQICVEVGVFGGSSFFPIAATLAFRSQGIAYAIDPWSNDACLDGYEKVDDNHHKYWGKVDLEKTLYKFMERMHKNGLDPTYAIMRMSSAQANLHFEDGSIDFIHIDGNHSEQSALFDVEHWLPKQGDCMINLLTSNSL